MPSELGPHLLVVLEILYVNVNAKFYKTTGVWKKGGKLLMNVYE